MGESNNTKKRREIIRQIIAQEKIPTQEALAERLRAMGLKATQSTISRDIQDLRLVKTGTPGQRYYTLPLETIRLKASEAMAQVYRTVVTNVAQTTNMVIVHTTSGMAQALCATMDQLNWEGVLGTLAGDDTVLIITKNEDTASEIVNVLNSL